MTKSIKKRFDSAEYEFVERPLPLPLQRDCASPQPYPIAALGVVLSGAAWAIMDKVQCPDAIAAQSVLATASLAAQAHADVVHPATGKRCPLSLFLVTVASSGERKSAADDFALSPVHLREAELHKDHEEAQRTFSDAHAAYTRAREAALRAGKTDRQEMQRKLQELGPAPQPPLVPLLTAPDPTLEGLHKLMAIGEPSIGLFTDEGGTFVDGYGMQDDSRVRTAAGLSKLWDGATVKRVRGGDGTTILRGRRLAMHIMVQPGIADRLLSQAELQNQGLPSRLLVAAPMSLAGSRMQRRPKEATEPALKAYLDAMLRLLRKLQKRASPSNPELDPIPLDLNVDAKKKWAAFADECERELAPGGRSEPIKGFANKAAEQALRIAGVLELVDNPAAVKVSAGTLTRAIELTRYYIGEALRLFEKGSIAVELQEAIKLLAWLHQNWGKPKIGLTYIYQKGPNSIRVAALARQTMAVLEQHHWVIRIDGGADIDGKWHREAWEIISKLS